MEQAHPLDRTPDRRKAWARLWRRAQVTVRRSNLFRILEIGQEFC